jgi:hypothetical protein
MHRGKVLFCRSEDIGGDRGTTTVERVANRYAAGLLMPAYLFEEFIGQRAITFALVEELAKAFRVSRTAAAIQLVDRADRPLMLVCHSRTKREWFHKSSLWPDELWPSDELDTRSRAFDIQFSNQPENRTMLRVTADAWYGRAAASRYDIRESTVRGGNGTTLSLIEIVKSVGRP